MTYWREEGDDCPKGKDGVHKYKGKEGLFVCRKCGKVVRV